MRSMYRKFKKTDPLFKVMIILFVILTYIAATYGAITIYGVVETIPHAIISIISLLFVITTIIYVTFVESLKRYEQEVREKNDL